MIQMTTAFAIVRAYQEIEAGENLLAQVEDALKDGGMPDLRDHFGRQRGFSLGVPMSDTSKSLYDVHPRLAAAVIRAHVGQKRAELEALNVQAWREAEAAAPAPEERARETR